MKAIPNVFSCLNNLWNKIKLHEIESVTCNIDTEEVKNLVQLGNEPITEDWLLSIGFRIEESRAYSFKWLSTRERGFSPGTFDVWVSNNFYGVDCHIGTITHKIQIINLLNAIEGN